MASYEACCFVGMPSIFEYLIDQGISPNRITSETAGERNANGDPSRWKTDRRVEIQLDTSK